MIKGFYTATTGLINRSAAINTISNNMANSSTAGYKKDELQFKSFGDHITYKLAADGTQEIGKTSSGVLIDGTHTYFDQGGLLKTNSQLDLAIEGEGFFTLQLPDGARGYTRNGQFKIDNDGYLSDFLGDRVLSTNGDPIKVGTSGFLVSQSGQVTVGGEDLGTILISRAGDAAELQKQGNSIYTAGNNAQMIQASSTIKQGYTEGSNVNMTQEMADLIENSRAFQSCSQIVKMLDRIMDKSVNEIARL